MLAKKFSVWKEKIIALGLITSVAHRDKLPKLNASQPPRWVREEE
jgi:hypothetical protein